MSSHKIILASGSPRRRQLLASIGAEFDVKEPNVDEEPHSGEAPASLVRRLAAEKGRSVAKGEPDRFVLAADTIVALPTDDGALGDFSSSSTGTASNSSFGLFKILGKPRDKTEAETMLAAIQDRRHVVYTAFWIGCLARKIEITKVVSSVVRIMPLSPQIITAYVRTGEPLDKAGAYAAQGIGAAFVREIRGSYTNVVGLPLSEVVEELLAQGAWHPDQLKGAK